MRTVHITCTRCSLPATRRVSRGTRDEEVALCVGCLLGEEPLLTARREPTPRPTLRQIAGLRAGLDSEGIWRVYQRVAHDYDEPLRWMKFATPEAAEDYIDRHGRKLVVA